MENKILKELDPYLIPDLANMVVDFMKCQKCNTLLEGKIKCECRQYMCKCNPHIICHHCKKVTCRPCYESNWCCKQYSIDSCNYCSKSFPYDYDSKEIGYCIFDNCKEKLCTKCSKQFKHLCRGHLLLRLHYPDNEIFQGIIGS